MLDDDPVEEPFESDRCREQPEAGVALLERADEPPVPRPEPCRQLSLQAAEERPPSRANQ